MLAAAPFVIYQICRGCFVLKMCPDKAPLISLALRSDDANNVTINGTHSR